VSDASGERYEELAQRVLGPLVLGGPIHPVRPFGARLALAFAVGRSMIDDDLRSRLDVARVRRARLLAPVDTVGRIDAAEFALVAALNDLLQVTNHELAGPLTRARHGKLLANVRAVCEAVPAPKDLAEALARHATFARVFEVARTDSTVRWWTGSARFRGQPPPRRLLAWRSVRQVRVDAQRVGLADLASGVSVPLETYRDVLGLWLTRTPLTDIANVARAAPPFNWSASTLALVLTPPGRSLAFRAVSRLPPGPVAAELARAAREVPPAFAEARRLAESFASEVAAAQKLAPSSST
jgi:hypothetical protein